MVLVPDPLPADLSESLQSVSARLGPLASRVLWFETVGSTNDVAVSLAEHDEDEGTIVVADAQEAGRGRLGRRWASPAGAGLYVSVVLRPLGRTPLITLAAGVGLARGLQAATGLDVDVKWPNDLYVGPRKVAGILSEAGSSGGRPFVVVGFGINVHRVSYPSDVAIRATSIEAELSRPVDRGVVLAESLVGLAEAYADVVAGRSEEILGAWRLRAGRTFGRVVEWDDAGVERTGVARDIDDTGALVVHTSSGVRRIIAGEVRWR